MKKLLFLLLLIPILCYSAPVRVSNDRLINSRNKIQQIKKNNDADNLLSQDTSKMDLIALRQYVGKLSLLVRDLVNMMGE